MKIFNIFRKPFIIDRSKWKCGSLESSDDCSLGMGSTRMLNCEGYYCCLGMVSKQLGVPDADLLYRATPADIGQKIPFLVTSTGYDTELSDKAMVINDALYTTVTEKEKRLKELFWKKAFLRLKFIN